MEEQKEITHQCSGQREDYSATQWGKPVRQRRCKICVGNPPKTIKGALNKAIGRVTKDMPLTQTSTTRNELVANLQALPYEVQTEAPQEQETEGHSRESSEEEEHTTNNTANDIAPLYTPSCQCPAKICRRQAEILPALAGNHYCTFCGPTPCSMTCACLCACDGGDYCSGDDYDDGH